MKTDIVRPAGQTDISDWTWDDGGPIQSCLDLIGPSFNNNGGSEKCAHYKNEHYVNDIPCTGLSTGRFALC
jgi:hypothetical protein